MDGLREPSNTLGHLWNLCTPSVQESLFEPPDDAGKFIWPRGPHFGEGLRKVIPHAADFWCLLVAKDTTRQKSKFTSERLLGSSSPLTIDSCFTLLSGLQVWKHVEVCDALHPVRGPSALYKVGFSNLGIAESLMSILYSRQCGRQG